MKSPRIVKLAAEDVEILIKELSLIIVSMDRIGSTYHDDPSRHASETDKFLLNVSAFKRLTRARAMISEAYHSQSSEAEIAELEESAEKMPYWQPPITPH